MHLPPLCILMHGQGTGNLLQCTPSFFTRESSALHSYARAGQHFCAHAGHQKSITTCPPPLIEEIQRRQTPYQACVCLVLLTALCSCTWLPAHAQAAVLAAALSVVFFMHLASCTCTGRSPCRCTFRGLIMPLHFPWFSSCTLLPAHAQAAVLAAALSVV